MDSERWIVRLFLSGGRSAHAGPFGDFDRACRRAEAVAKRCKRRGVNASVTVRPLSSGAIPIDDLIESAAERGSFHVGSYAGVPERNGDVGEREVEREVARAILERGGGQVALLPGNGSDV